MELLKKSCDNYLQYPLNLVHHNIVDYDLDAYKRSMDDPEGSFGRDLWEEEEYTDVNLNQLEENSHLFEHATAKSDAQLAQLLHRTGLKDPICRFVFIRAKNSRDLLKITQAMCARLLTYHQVPPSFLDLLFQFGYQEHKQDFHFSAFHSELHPQPSNSASIPLPTNALAIPSLGRSPHYHSVSYTLRTCESSPHTLGQSHTIRTAAIYHSLDLETGRAVWIAVKGHTNLRSRLEALTDPRSGRPEAREYSSSPAAALRASLAVHQTLAAWTAAEWRWYVNGLEEGLRRKVERVETFQARAESVLDLGKAAPNPTNNNNNAGDAQEEGGGSEASFDGLRMLQLLEDRANEAVLVLEGNMDMLSKLSAHYSQDGLASLLLLPGPGDDDAGVAAFASRLASIRAELGMHRTRALALQRKMADKKALLASYLSFASGVRMQRATDKMHLIAVETKQETVSMRIITLVTLFFLPGTFISTLMSTDIIRFEVREGGRGEKRKFSGMALKYYLGISVPFIVVTFLVWYWLYLRSKRRNKELAGAPGEGKVTWWSRARWAKRAHVNVDLEKRG